MNTGVEVKEVKGERCKEPLTPEGNCSAERRRETKLALFRFIVSLLMLINILLQFFSFICLIIMFH